MDKKDLKKYANALMFEMSDEQYETLQQEFDTILKQMDLITKIGNIENIEPMTFPFENFSAKWRGDIKEENLTVDEILKNAKDVMNDQIKVPKVVE